MLNLQNIETQKKVKRKNYIKTIISKIIASFVLFITFFSFSFDFLRFEGVKEIKVYAKEKTTKPSNNVVNAAILKKIDVTKPFTFEGKNYTKATNKQILDNTRNNLNPLINFIGNTEANNDFNAVYGESTKKVKALRSKGTIENVTNIEIKDIPAYQDKLLKKIGHTVIGAYQIKGDTFSFLVKSYPDIFPADRKMDESCQRDMATLLLIRRGALKYQRGEINQNEFVENVSKEWASMPKDRSGNSYYENVGNNKALVTYKQLTSAIENTYSINEEKEFLVISKRNRLLEVLEKGIGTLLSPKEVVTGKMGLKTEKVEKDATTIISKMSNEDLKTLSEIEGYTHNDIVKAEIERRNNSNTKAQVGVEATTKNTVNLKDLTQTNRNSTGKDIINELSNLDLDGINYVKLEESEQTVSIETFINTKLLVLNDKNLRELLKKQNLDSKVRKLAEKGFVERVKGFYESNKKENTLERNFDTLIQDLGYISESNVKKIFQIKGVKNIVNNKIEELEKAKDPDLLSLNELYLQQALGTNDTSQIEAAKEILRRTQEKVKDSNLVSYTSEENKISDLKSEIQEIKKNSGLDSQIKNDKIEVRQQKIQKLQKQIYQRNYQKIKSEGESLITELRKLEREEIQDDQLKNRKTILKEEINQKARELQKIKFLTTYGDNPKIQSLIENGNSDVSKLTQQDLKGVNIRELATILGGEGIDGVILENRLRIINATSLEERQEILEQIKHQIDDYKGTNYSKKTKLDEQKAKLEKTIQKLEKTTKASSRQQNPQTEKSTLGKWVDKIKQRWKDFKDQKTVDKIGDVANTISTVVGAINLVKNFDDMVDDIKENPINLINPFSGNNVLSTYGSVANTVNFVTGVRTLPGLGPIGSALAFTTNFDTFRKDPGQLLNPLQSGSIANMVIMAKLGAAAITTTAVGTTATTGVGTALTGSLSGGPVVAAVVFAAIAVSQLLGDSNPISKGINKIVAGVGKVFSGISKIFGFGSDTDGIIGNMSGHWHSDIRTNIYQKIDTGGHTFDSGTKNWGLHEEGKEYNCGNLPVIQRGSGKAAMCNYGTNKYLCYRGGIIITVCDKSSDVYNGVDPAIAKYHFRRYHGKGLQNRETYTACDSLCDKYNEDSNARRKYENQLQEYNRGQRSDKPKRPRTPSPPPPPPPPPKPPVVTSITINPNKTHTCSASELFKLTCNGYDPDGSIVEYGWSNGKTGQTIQVSSGIYACKAKDNENFMSNLKTVEIKYHQKPNVLITGKTDIVEGEKTKLICNTKEKAGDDKVKIKWIDEKTGKEIGNKKDIEVKAGKYTCKVDTGFCNSQDTATVIEHKIHPEPLSCNIQFIKDRKDISAIGVNDSFSFKLDRGKKPRGKYACSLSAIDENYKPSVKIVNPGNTLKFNIASEISISCIVSDKKTNESITCENNLKIISKVINAKSLPSCNIEFRNNSGEIIEKIIKTGDDYTPLFSSNSEIIDSKCYSVEKIDSNIGNTIDEDFRLNKENTKKKEHKTMQKIFTCVVKDKYQNSAMCTKTLNFTNTVPEGYCGDWVVNRPNESGFMEECDSGYGCKSDCTYSLSKQAKCGDGIVQGEEQCDGQDRCSNKCKWK